MSYIHEHQDWPKLTWDLEILVPRLVKVHRRIASFSAKFEGLEAHYQKEAVLRTLSVEIVNSSEIEGEFINIQEVKSSIAKKLKIDVRESRPASEHVERIVDLTVDAVKNFDFPLTAQRLFQWHRDLFPNGRSSGFLITTGAWRPIGSEPMQIVSGALGKEKIHYEAPSPERLIEEMATFLKWVNDSKEIDPVLKAGIASFWFLTIHPFQDGNGRISRAISEMLLARADNSKDRYYSMSSQIFSERQVYYDELERQQKNGLDITEWLLWYVDCLDRSLDRADERLQNIIRNARFWQQAGKLKLNDRQIDILYRMLGETWVGFMNTSKYSKMSKCSDATSQRDIRDLVRKGIFVQNPTSGPKTSFRLHNLEEI